MKTRQTASARTVFTCFAWTVAIFLASTSMSWSQEHPEHPRAASKPKSAVAMEDVARQIESYVGSESKDGIFAFNDLQTGEELSLTLENVHRDRLSQVETDLYFACADFSGVNGNTYDLDFFLQGTSQDNLRVLPDSTSIHKVNGVARYAWALDEESQVWVRKPVEAKAQKPSVPEHP